jgi:shikimate kinase
MTEGRAFCHGAATIVNGIAIGKGASFGIGLRTEARVLLTGDPDRFTVIIENDPAEDPNLARFCVESVLERFGLSGLHGAEIDTRSNIPISRGLKSSSTAANAITIATFLALGERYSDRDIIDTGIDASFKAGVTITGAYDDACASYYGGVVVTDNRRREIQKRYTMDQDLSVIIHVPDEKIRKSTVDTRRLDGIAPVIRGAHDLALSGHYQSAMVINGLSYGSAMGLDTDVTFKAIRGGALTAGITGTGPATVIIALPEDADRVVSALGSGNIIRTKPNIIKAGPMP